MADSTDVLIGDAGAQHVLVRPLRRSQPGLFDSSEGNGIECEIAIAAGGFRAIFPAHLRSEEFQSFLEQLQDLDRTLDGTATLSALEGQLSLSLSGSGDRPLAASGEAIDDTGGSNRLQFKFDMDRTYLPTIAASLQHLLAAYPVLSDPLR